jgi:hypothetical protein
MSDGTITICFNRRVLVRLSIQPLMRHALILLLVYHVTSQLYMNWPAYKQFGQKLHTMMPKPILFVFKYYLYSCVATATIGTITCTLLILSHQGRQILV